MNNIENFSQEKSFSNYKNNFKRVLAGTAASVIAFSSAGCGATSISTLEGSRSISTSTTEIETTGTSSLQEPSITDLPTTRETSKSTTTKESTTKESTTKESTTKETTTASTTEVESKYDLKNVAPERLQFTKDLLNLYDESVKDSDSAFNSIKKYLTTDQIIKYGETGKGLTTINDKKGNEIVLVNFNKTLSTGLNESISFLSKLDSKVVEKMSNNGLKAIMYSKYDNYQEKFFHSNNEGLITKNVEDLNPDILKDSFTSAIALESYRIKIRQLGGKYESKENLIALSLLSDCWWNMYKKTKDERVKAFAYFSYLEYKGLKSTYKSSSIEELPSMIETIQNENLVTPYGGNWNEIKNSLSDRPNWNAGDNF